MKRILLVDDDAVVLRMYQDALTKKGYDVVAAADGIGALQALRASRPDLVVLDLMMPRFTGVDVLKYMRGQADFRELPVILLSNSFMNDLAGQAVAIGVQRALLKMRCSASYLVGLIEEVLAGRRGTADPSQLLAVPQTAPPPQPRATSVAPATPAVPGAECDPAARQELLHNATKIRTDLHALSQGVVRAKNEVEADMRSNDYYRRVHFLTVAAGLAGAHDIALLSSAFEALLFELMGRPTLLTPSVKRTMAFTTDFLSLLLGRLHEAQIKTPIAPKALVVDDDPLSNRLVSAALRRAQLTARSSEDPLLALQWAQESRFDLFLLDVQMPGMEGFEFCKRLRAQPEYQRTPVIFVTSRNDFESRAQSVLSGGNDLIAKPVLPIELAVKAVTHLLKTDLESSQARPKH